MISYPIILVAAVYLAVLLPTYFLLKKYKPSYWWMVLMTMAELIFINTFCLFVLYKDFSSDLFFNFLFLGTGISVLLSMIIPIIFINYQTKKKRIRSVVLAFVLTILFVFLHACVWYHLISLSTQAWSKYFN